MNVICDLHRTTRYNAARCRCGNVRVDSNGSIPNDVLSCSRAVLHRLLWYPHMFPAIECIGSGLSLYANMFVERELARSYRYSVQEFTTRRCNCITIYIHVYIYIYIYVLRILNRGRVVLCNGFPLINSAAESLGLHQQLLGLAFLWFVCCLHFSTCACHPCAGAMLIFSLWL